MNASRAKKLLAPWMSRRPSIVTAVDFDGQVVRIAQARGGRRPKLAHLAHVPLPDDIDHNDAEACGVWLGKILKELKINTGSGAVMGVPRAQVMLKPLTLPMPDDPRELAGMVHFQVNKELPFPAEDAVVDFTIHGYSEPAAPPASSEDASASGDADDEQGEEQPAAPTVDVLAAITRRSVVEHYQQKAEAAGLKLIGLGLRSYANVRTVEACGVDNREKAVALVSLRPDEVIIDILVESRLAFSRMAAANLHGHHHDEDAQPDSSGDPDEQVDLAKPDVKPLIAAVTKEVVRSLHGYRAHPDHKEVAAVLVSGDTGPEQAVADALAERLGLPCKQINPAEDLSYSGAAAEHASAAIAAIGLAIGATDRQGLPFDFFNPKKPMVKRDTRPIKIAAAVGFLVLFFGFTMYQRATMLGERENTLAQVQQNTQEHEESRRQYQLLAIHETSVQDWLESRRSWLDHYLYLSAVLPPSDEVYLSTFSTTTRGNIRLNLHARSGAVLIDVDRRLRDAGYEVNPLAITPGNDPHGYNFRTSVELAVPAGFEFAPELEEIEVPERPEDDAYRLQAAARAAVGRAIAEGGRSHE